MNRDLDLFGSPVDASEQHYGFVASGLTPVIGKHRSERIDERFEVKSAAVERARLMFLARFTDIRCFEVIRIGGGQVERLVDWRKSTEVSR